MNGIKENFIRNILGILVVHVLWRPSITNHENVLVTGGVEGSCDSPGYPLSLVCYEKGATRMAHHRPVQVSVSVVYFSGGVLSPWSSFRCFSLMDI